MIDPGHCFRDRVDNQSALRIVAETRVHPATRRSQIGERPEVDPVGFEGRIVFVLVQRELESRSCPNWFGRGEVAHLVPPLGATDTGGLEFAIARFPDLGVPAGQAIVRRDVPTRAVQPAGVVLHHEVPDHPPRVLQVQRRLRAKNCFCQV